MSLGRYIWRSPWQVVVGDRDVTRHVDQLRYSNVDPGGFETCSISLANPVEAPRAGDRITIRHGLEVAFDGRVNDPGNADHCGRIVEQITGVGHGAALKDNRIREIFRDVDFSNWQGSPSVQRQINLVSNYNIQAGSVEHDQTTGAPSLRCQLTTPWSTSNAIVETLYDAGAIEIDSIAYAWKKNSTISEANTNWQWDVILASDDVLTSTNGSGNLRAAGPGSGTLSASSTAKYYACARLIYAASASGTSGVDNALYWTSLAVYGTHGLTLRGTEPDAGFYPTDIASHVLADYNNSASVTIDEGPVDTDDDAYHVRHAVYREYVPHERVIDDMVRLQLGWHWGVWEPDGLHSTSPRLFMTKPPEEATCSISRRDLGEDFDAPRVRLDALYDVAAIRFSDVSGRQRVTTASRSNPLLDQAGLSGRTLDVDAGVSTAAAAQTLGQFALALAERASRGGGSATVPRDVHTPSGTRPGALLKAGRDRIRITDLPDPGPLHESDTRRFDTFHVRRVETTVDRQGVPQTRVELGTGADLMEVLQARAQAALVNLR